MNARVKAGVFLALFVVLYGVWVYMTRDGHQKVAEQWMALGPINWVDFGAGAVIMFLTMMTGFVALSLFETRRFKDEIDGGDGSGGSGGGTPKRVRMPMSIKVIDIKSWKPPPGQYHRGTAEAST